MSALRQLGNALAYGLRRRLRFRRGPPALLDEGKTALFDFLEPHARSAMRQRACDLEALYDLGPLKKCSTCADYRDNLYVLDALEKVWAGQSLGDCARVVDVGSKNWNYVFGLERFWRRRASGELHLEGVEIDGHGIYPDLRARCDYAEAYVGQVGNPLVRYRVADFLDCTYQDLDAITMFFPFLTRNALLRWGLPTTLFQPQRLLMHAAQCLRPGGHLVVFHQTHEERDRLLELVASLDLEVRQATPIASDLVTYRSATADRWGVLLRRYPGRPQM